MKKFYTYILASQKNGTLYIGITSDLVKRIYEHKNKITGGFSAKYNVNMLVYYEVFDDAENAIVREKRMKKLYRKEKIELIEKFNPEWKDLYNKIV
jgi:putative endonuclease